MYEIVFIDEAFISRIINVVKHALIIQNDLYLALLENFRKRPSFNVHIGTNVRRN